jgi:hypothetical protein
LNERFRERGDLDVQVARTLDPDPDNPSLRTLALYGIGGAGKTQTALRYAYRSRAKFDAVLWISSDTHTGMSRDYLKISQRLGLTPSSAELPDPTDAITKTKRWLLDTSKRGRKKAVYVD